MERVEPGGGRRRHGAGGFVSSAGAAGTYVRGRLGAVAVAVWRASGDFDGWGHGKASLGQAGRCLGFGVGPGVCA